MTQIRLPMLGSPRAAPGPIVALPTVIDLELYAGDDFYLDLTVTNPDGTAADLTTAVASAQIRAAANAADPMATFAATITGNVIHLHLTAAAAASLVSGVWDCQIA